AGENHGTLPQTLGELAIDHSRRMKWFQQDSVLNNTVMYAWMVTTVFVFVSGFIMYWIVPKYKEIFNDFGVELPRVTNSFVHLADWFVNYWYLLIPAMGTPFVIIYGLIAIGAGQYRRLPGFLYGVWPRLTTPSILRSLSGVATAGEPMAQLLRDLADTAPSWQLMSRYDRIRRRVEGGEQLPIALQLEGVINLREMAALDHATHVGHLPWALTAIADRIEDLRHRRIRTVIEILKPFTILFVGLLVFLFCVSMFLPLVKLLNELS
ncbi:MAG: type II secretion system F family protein, partial [Planctomycetaceae bacterium]|nr:type II secretion system F family protein [Planctomycetaceae bacterium]